MYTESTIAVLTLYEVHMEIKARSPMVTKIFKSQIGHATHVSWSTFAKESDYNGSCEAISGSLKWMSGQGQGKKVKVLIP